MESAQPSAGGSLRAELSGLGELVEAAVELVGVNEVFPTGADQGGRVLVADQLKRLRTDDATVLFGPVQKEGKVCGTTPD